MRPSSGGKAGGRVARHRVREVTCSGRARYVSARLGDQVDLVGHDWGGGFVVRVVSTRLELVRSWVTDAAGIGDAGFEWHDFARIWQTPQAGEDFWDQQLAAPAQERAGVFQSSGCPRRPALDLASHLTRTMADCILDLYRSAVDVGRQWGPDFAAIPAPGLVIIPGEDPFLSGGPGDQGRRPGRRQDGRPGRVRPLVDAPGPCPGGGRAARVLGHRGLTPPAPAGLAVRQLVRQLTRCPAGAAADAVLAAPGGLCLAPEADPRFMQRLANAHRTASGRFDVRRNESRPIRRSGRSHS